MLLRRGERKQQQLPTEWTFKNANKKFNPFNLKYIHICLCNKTCFDKKKKKKRVTAVFL